MYVSPLLTPKQSVVYLYDSDSVEYALKKLRASGFKEVPVITKEGKYCGVISEGNFLWNLLDEKAKKQDKVINFCRKTNPAIRITTTVDGILERIMDENFIPVIDDRGYFCGIVTRKNVIKHLVKIVVNQQQIPCTTY